MDETIAANSPVQTNSELVGFDDDVGGRQAHLLRVTTRSDRPVRRQQVASFYDDDTNSQPGAKWVVISHPS